MVFVAAVLLAISLLVLVRASQEAVLRGAKLARLTGASEVAIGFLLLAVGTSLPELAVSLFSSFVGESQIALGTLLGSNISDVTLIFGTAALFGTITWSRKEYLVSRSVFAPLAIAFVAMLLPELGAGFGIFALALFALFLAVMAKGHYISETKERRNSHMRHIIMHFAVLCAAIAAVIISAYGATNSTVEIARTLGIPEIFISGIIIAVGTSLPELAVSVQAIRNGRSGLALGNIAGSVVTNLGLVLGLAAIMRPLPIMPLDRAWLAATIVTSALFLWLSSRRKVGLGGGVGLITLWLAVIVVLTAISLL